MSTMSKRMPNTCNHTNRIAQHATDRLNEATRDCVLSKVECNGEKLNSARPGPRNRLSEQKSATQLASDNPPKTVTTASHGPRVVVSNTPVSVELIDSD